MKNKLQLLNIFSFSNAKSSKVPMLISIRKGLTYMIPLLLIGSFALLILSFPLPFYQNLMAQLFGRDWEIIFLFVRDGTFHTLSLFMVISISYSYVNDLGDENHISPIIASFVALGSFMAISGISLDGFTISNFGTTGIFLAIIVATTSASIFVKLSSIRFIKMRAYTNGANDSFNFALSSILPFAFTILIFAGIHTVLLNYLHITIIQNDFSQWIIHIFLKIDSPLMKGLIFVFLIHILWFFGMHGSNILESVVQTVYTPGTQDNLVLIRSGLPPEHIFTKTFFDSFVLMGGCGTAICLVAAILLAGNFKNQRGLAKLSLLPLTFNINELIIFGIPIVLNPIFLIPFIGVPLMLTMISFLAMDWGIVPLTSHSVEWTTPVLLSGYFATQSVNGSLLQLFNLFFGTACYIPFVKASERVSAEQLNVNLEKITAVFKENESRGYPSNLLARHDEIGNIARFLASDLSHDFLKQKIRLHYQPQADSNGNVFGVEALLRWKHDLYGYIYPPLVIALAEESHMIDNLGYWIFDQSLSDLKQMQNRCQNITLSVNVSASQLENEDFAFCLADIARKNGVPCSSLKLEITEQIALTGSNKTMEQIQSIKNLGIQMVIDDFGMGHNSLKYLKEYDFDVIKLDGSLVKEIVSDNNCKSIVSSIIYLCNSLNYSIIAEYVETKEQKDILWSLGCFHYQGYFYSKPLPFEEFIDYLSGLSG